jgi:hypothetical protein
VKLLPLRHCVQNTALREAGVSRVPLLFAAYLPTSAEDPGCLSRILIFSIPDLGSNNDKKRGGWEKIVVLPHFVAPNFTKLEIFNF